MRPASALSPEHRAALDASAITEDVIEARGYFTATRKAQLRDLGFSPTQQLVPALVVPVLGFDGEPVLYQARPDLPRMRQGKPVKYETVAGSRMAVDIPPAARSLLGDPSIPLFITEGVKKGDALASQGLCAVALLGVWNFRGTNERGGKTLLPEFEAIALNARRTYLVFDSDVMLKPEVANAMQRLSAALTVRDAKVAYIYLPSGPAGEKLGVDDYLAQGHGVDDLLALATSELRSVNAESEPEPAGTQAEALIRIGSQAELFHDAQGNPFGRIEIDDHLETWAIGSKARQFRRWLLHEYFRAEGKAPGRDAVASAIGVLEGIAVFEGPQHDLAVRVSRLSDRLYYDLTDGQWRAVRVDEHGWQVVDRPPPLFRRYTHQAPQVVPLPGGRIERLFDFLNVAESSRLLLAVWLVTAFIPDIPHPIPNFHGEKGAGKSVGQRVLRRLIDPSHAEALTFPSEIRELVQQLAHHYAPVYDNVDAVPPWLSDALCRAVTGEAFTKRELFSDDDDVLYAYQRIPLLNSVNVVPQRSDLLDRSVLIELERIPPERRREERDFWAAFEAERPYLLGAICDALSGAMRLYEQVAVPRLPRMADFTRWGAAVAEALGYGAEAFVDAYAANLGLQTREAVEGDLVGAALLALMEGREEWTGTHSELLAALEDAGEHARLFRRTSSGKVDGRGWPGAPHILSRRLNTLRSNLRDLGIELGEPPRGDQRLIVIQRGTPPDGETSDGSVGSVGPPATVEDNPVANDASDATSDGRGGDMWEAVIR